MNLHQLKYVLTVAKERSFSKAAAELYITQPSLSRFIISWEDQLGAKVFDRSTSPLGLTAAGRSSSKPSRAFAISRKNDGRPGCAPAFGRSPDQFRGHADPGVLPHQTHRPVQKRLSQRQDPHQRILYEPARPAAAKGELDFIFGAGPATDPNLDFLQISTEQLYLITPKNKKRSRLRIRSSSIGSRSETAPLRPSPALT